MSAPLSAKLEWELMNPILASTLNPIVANPANSSNIVKGILLKVGATVINHGLGRLMQGWTIVDVNGAATIYRSAPLSSTTLTLTSNAAVVVNIEVF